jgi:hypothetical protein
MSILGMDRSFDIKYGTNKNSGNRLVVSPHYVGRCDTANIN